MEQHERFYRRSSSVRVVESSGPDENTIALTEREREKYKECDVAVLEKINDRQTGCWCANFLVIDISGRFV